MQANTPESGPISVGKPNLIKPYQLLTALTAVLVLLQAILAGQGWFEEADFMDLHEFVANIFFLVVVAQLVMTWVLRIPGKLGQRLLAMGVLLLALTFVQIGLGYAGRETAQAAAWHIPNGVLLFGLAGAISSLAAQLRGSA